MSGEVHTLYQLADRAAQVAILKLNNNQRREVLRIGEEFISEHSARGPLFCMALTALMLSVVMVSSDPRLEQPGTIAKWEPPK